MEVAHRDTGSLRIAKVQNTVRKWIGTLAILTRNWSVPPPYQDLQDLRDLCDPQDRPAGQVFQAPEEFTTKSVARRGARGYAG